MKNKRRNRLLKTLVWLGLIGGVFWLAVAPPPHRPAPVLGAGVKVAVTPPVESEPAPSPGSNPTAGRDERAEPEGAPPLPVAPPPARRAGAGPEIAIVIDDVGLDLKDSRRAADLPAFITLSYMPYATRLREQTEEAREAGHELLLHMPMEPMGHNDPGPGALLVGLPPDELRQRFDTALASFTGFDGVNNHMGSKFTADAAGMELVMAELKPRHLFFLDSRTSAQSVGFATARRMGVAAVARDVFLDDDMSEAAVRRQLALAEKTALRKGSAIAIGHPHPATLDALEAWLPQAQARGIAFVPLRDLVAPAE